MKKRIFILHGLLLVVLLTGCVQQKSEESGENPAIAKCISECRNRLALGEDLKNGPCLSNDIHPDWVCDVAHSPRQQVDNIPENQCSAFREGKAHHFVEVDEGCNLIRAV